MAEINIEKMIKEEKGEMKMFKYKKKDRNKEMTEEEFIKCIISECADEYNLIIDYKPNCIHVFLGGRKEEENDERTNQQRN